MTLVPDMTYREYHPETGALLNNVSTLAFGKVTRGTHTRVKVIDVAFANAQNVGNIKIGLVADAGISINSASDSGTIYPDGSVANGHFGVTSSQDFNASISAEPLGTHFPGVNDTATADNSNNVSVGSRTQTVSNYIYLDIEVGSGSSGVGNGAYKIFFDFS